MDDEQNDVAFQAAQSLGGALYLPLDVLLISCRYLVTPRCLHESTVSVAEAAAEMDVLVIERKGEQ